MPDIGLRFHRSDARRLRELEHDVRSGTLIGDVSTFEQAALAAELGEPLVVHCQHPDEVFQMAALYTSLGLCQPAIEPLSR